MAFYKSITDLKTVDESQYLKSKNYKDFLTDHSNILEICKAGKKIPPISLDQAKKLLKRIKPAVTDLFSISSLHYLNGGDVAVEHFCLLLNAILGCSC